MLLVLDATTGQNALSQAKLFGEKSGVTGLVLTKLDGTAKGGIVIAIRNELDLPVKLLGLARRWRICRNLIPSNSFMRCLAACFKAWKKRRNRAINGDK